MASPFSNSTELPADFVPFSPDAAEKSLPEYFTEVASRFPTKLAVSDFEKSLDYSTLQLQNSRVAAAIQRATATPSAPMAIGLIFEPTVESVVGIMGVLMSGNFICPISPNDPPARILNYLEDAEIDIILSTRDAFPEGLQSKIHPRKVLFIDDSDKEITEADPPTRIDTNQLAAILYTSGSTGKPKGVTHTHKTLMDMIRNKGNELGISPSDRIAGLARFTFGSYYLNVFGTLMFGASLHLYDFYRFHFEGLKQWLIDRQITLFHCTPTTLRQFLEVLNEPTVFPDLRLVSLGGETLYPDDVYRFQDMLSCSTALCTTGAAIETWFYTSVFLEIPFPDGINQIPMGFTNPDCLVEVRDENNLLLTNGQKGEIIVSAGALSPGYWNRPELNEKKFILGENNKRYFCSGDLGTFSPEGLLYHKGRIDFQIKIRGMRVDLGEIEAALHGHPEVKEAIVVGHIRKNNDTELIAYICSNDASTISPGEIYGFLATKLSPHQIPTRTIFLESFPLTRTHKIDRNALPDPDEIEYTSDTPKIAPRNAIEACLHEFWIEILGHEGFGVTEPFLELGGDSLGAMRIRARIEPEFNASIPLREFFIAGSIESLAALINKHRK